MNRRTFVKATALLATSGTGLLGYAAIVEPHWLEIVRRDLPVANLPRELNGATLAHVSDLHACSYVDEGYLTSSLDRLRRLSPDIVVLTGDLVTWERDRPAERNLAQLRRVLSHFPHGRLTTVAVLGNHDYGRMWRDNHVAGQVTGVARESGIRVLRNEVATAAGLDIIGVDDLWAGLADPRRALAQRTSAAAIALCHNPDALDLLPWTGYAGWILAGHTHGGQCQPPFLPPPILPVDNPRYTAGEIAVDRHRTLYISRGVGYMLRIRFNVRPEITVFTMRTA